jgi:hypothetical protein
MDAEASATIRLPGFMITVKIDDVERRVARELVIRLADRRILNAWECCDGCIDGALNSLQEIRRLLVDKQVELANRTDSALYLLIEFMAVGIRQFLTYEQGLHARTDVVRQVEVREGYFAGLEMLRAHLHRTMSQVAVISGSSIPRSQTLCVTTKLGILTNMCSTRESDRMGGSWPHPPSRATHLASHVVMKRIGVLAKTLE